MISQGEIWWAEPTSRLQSRASADGMSAEGDLGAPVGSAPGFRRPVLVVQGDAFNHSRIATVVCVPLTSNLKWVGAPGNLMIKAKASGLDRDSVANASGVVALDKAQLVDRVGKVTARKLALVLAGIGVVLGGEFRVFRRMSPKY